MYNWKTNVAGLSTVLTSLGALIHILQTKDYSNLTITLAGLLTGIGLLFAKDHDVTGGSKNQGSTPIVVQEKMQEIEKQFDTKEKL